MDAKERNFSLIEYFNRKVKGFSPKYGFNAVDASGFESWKRELLAELKKGLGPMPEAVALNPEIVCEVKEDGLIKRRVLLDLEEDMSVAALVYIPEGALTKPAAGILCNHGHGDYGKDSVMGVVNACEPERASEIATFNYDYGLQMAKRGYVTIAIDWRGFGERSDSGNPYQERDACNMNFIKGGILGVNLLALDIFDGMRALDYFGAFSVKSGNYRLSPNRNAATTTNRKQ